VQPRDPSYEAVAALDRTDIDAYGKKVPLKPDMLLRADVILNRISLVQWLLDPLLARRM
jgi:membrane fusion protein